MAEQVIDYQCVLRDLKKRRDRLDAAITAIQEIMVENSSQAASKITLIPESTKYSSMTIGDAAADYLKSTGKKQSTSKIASALTRGGIASESKSLYRTVYNTLTLRATKPDADVVRAGKDWEFRLPG